MNCTIGHMLMTYYFVHVYNYIKTIVLTVINSQRVYNFDLWSIWNCSWNKRYYTQYASMISDRVMYIYLLMLP